VASGATYYFQVVAVAGDGVTVSSPSSPVASAATTSGSTTTTTTVGATTTTLAGGTTTTVPATTTTLAVCRLTNLVVTPTSGVLDKNGYLVGVTNSTFQLSVNASGPCANVTVSYTPTGSVTYYATLSGTIPGTLTGIAGGATTIWSPGNQPFTVNVNGTTPYVPLVQVLVGLCQYKGNSGHC
jgi:hypothetical protein